MLSASERCNARRLWLYLPVDRSCLTVDSMHSIAMDDDCRMFADTSSDGNAAHFVKIYAPITNHQILSDLTIVMIPARCHRR
jgi:hypothetical protein